VFAAPAVQWHAECVATDAVVQVVAVLGLGEAGAIISRDLVASGVTVRGYDPVAGAPDGVVATGSDAEACAGADLVLSLTTAHEAEAALAASLPASSSGSRPGPSSAGSGSRTWP